MTTIIPNQLNITINTSIPGYQKIEYKPFMTIPGINKDDKYILFNPTVKLDKKIVDKVPENVRKKQFFNKGLFDSLLNFTNGTKANTLSQATQNGYVDNNIQVTLHTIFPENSVLYVNNKPYSIADVQWSTSNWRIDKKTKKIELDSSKVIDPVLYQTIVKDEIISGENQLSKLSPGLVYGDNYTGPKSDYRLFATASGVTGKNNNVIQVNNSISTNAKTNATSESSLQSNVTLPLVIEPTTPIKESIRPTNFLREFFRESAFFDMISEIYSESDEATKEIIKKSLNQKTTSFNLNYFSKKMNRISYNESVSELKVIENSGKGNCFFIAVADGINYHNYYNQNDRIISGRYGTGVNLYTQMYLRTLVSDYIINDWYGLDNYLENIAPINAENLNTLFEKQINKIKQLTRNSSDITRDNYIGIANSIFNSNDNFLVKNIDDIPMNIDDYYKPFNVLEKNQINKYILNSNFWANEIVIYALCSKLKLNIIPIQPVRKSGKEIIRIPFANFERSLNIWNKYLFLYYNKSHFELLTFTNKTNGSKNLSTLKTIFNKNDDLPPIYMLFIIFGSYFSSIKDNENRKNFTYKKEIMFAIQNIIDNNLYNKTNYSSFFYPIFKSYFPNGNIRVPSTTTNSKGGATPLYNPYLVKNMVKKDNNRDDSQLAYYITIDMEVKPGTSLTQEEIKNSKCNRKWNSIRKSYSEVVGKPYVITPVYQNDTRKYGVRGGKRNKTKKL